MTSLGLTMPYPTFSRFSVLCWSWLSRLSVLRRSKLFLFSETCVFCYSCPTYTLISLFSTTFFSLFRKLLKSDSCVFYLIFLKSAWLWSSIPESSRLFCFAYKRSKVAFASFYRLAGSSGGTFVDCWGANVCVYCRFSWAASLRGNCSECSFPIFRF